MEYATFEGTIPRGEYGGGSVTIWDDGRYELEKWRDDEVIVTARRAPRRTARPRAARADPHRRARARSRRWLLHRMKTDTDGRPAAGRDAGRGLCAGGRAGGRGARRGGAFRPRRGRRPSARPKSPASATEAAPDAGAAAARGPRPPTRCGRCCRPARRPSARSSRRASGATRSGRRRSGTASARSACGTASACACAPAAATTSRAKYPELTEVDAGLGDEPAIVDGEIVAIDERGRPELPAAADAHEPAATGRDRARGEAHARAVLPVRRARRARARRHRPCPLARAARDPRGRSPPASSLRIVVPPVFDDVDAALATSRQVRPRGDRGQGSGVDLPPRRAQRVVAQGQAHPHPGGRDRRHPARARAGARGRSARCCSASPGPTDCSTRAGSASGSATRPCARSMRTLDAAAHRPRTRSSASRPLDARGRAVGAARARRRGRVRRVHARRHPAPLAVAGPAARQVARRGRARGLTGLARGTRCRGSGVRVVLDVAGRLELEGRVLDVEVLARGTTAARCRIAPARPSAQRRRRRRRRAR